MTQPTYGFPISFARLFPVDPLRTGDPTSRALSFFGTSEPPRFGVHSRPVHSNFLFF